MCGIYKNLQAFLLYLKETNDINACFVFSPGFHIQYLCEYLHSKGANINHVYSSTDNYTALYVAAHERQNEIAKYLITQGIDIEKINNRYGSVFNVAVISNNTELVELLNSRWALIESKRKITDLTNLHIAVLNENKRVVEILISRGAKINDNRNMYHITPLSLASLLNYKEIAQLLISHNASISFTDIDGNNAINFALMYNSEKIKEKIITDSGEIFKLYGQNSESNKDMIEFLISKGANVNEKNSHGNTPLHIAALLYNKENAEVLISHGAEINCLNKKRQTPLDIAIMRYKRENEAFMKNNEFQMNSILENNRGLIDSFHEESEMESLLKSHGGKTNPNSNFIDEDDDILYEYIIKEHHNLYNDLAMVSYLTLAYLILKHLDEKFNNLYFSMFCNIMEWILTGIICVHLFYFFKALLK
ncbi:hypothetical protein TVAG_284340 [Trichomonas vaginalis G3]|uniref:Uncharacterized protein n=1 Tax=Trichomonas vaginalis (strain ATCC PRA-98 / G3) TaxID=412133 RepID=A2EN92_TRIV3|nr:spectrin binding [Trichomonas vaginalis G3]EAY05851.1 hypothetical protein TVAG_284340 [Trichomonas vaginalis G3]KAI5531631.1 spectrin binding [Trichomonas vaginalis G3]|eukprot:XP_001318074.1 hypothetical protein [Trichomonas vaginalis G3]